MTNTSRRALLRAGALGVALAPFAAPRAASAAAGPAGLYRRRRFTPLLRASFQFASKATGSWSVRLIQVSDLPQGKAGDDDAFSLTFQASAEGPPQGTYTLRRSRFTSTTLFIVPSDESHRTYQAVINRGS